MLGADRKARPASIGSRPRRRHARTVLAFKVVGTGVLVFAAKLNISGNVSVESFRAYIKIRNKGNIPRRRGDGSGQCLLLGAVIKTGGVINLAIRTAFWIATI